MRDTHAGLAPVLEEMRSVNPNMHHNQTARATDDKIGAERQRRGWAGQGRAGQEKEERTTGMDRS